jgi:hypothetical protein
LKKITRKKECESESARGRIEEKGGMEMETKP